MNGTSILVIGAGILGSALTSELTRRGCQVTLVDQGEAGEQTTDASFAWVNAFDKEPTSYALLNYQGLRTHERWAAQAGRRWFHQTGHIKVTKDEQRLAELEQLAARLRDIDYAVDRVTPDRIQQIEPGLDISGVLGGFHFPREGWVDTKLMCLSLIGESVRAGAQFLPYHRVLELTDSGALVQNPAGEVQTLTADTTVVTAGNGTKALGETLGLDIPILPATFSRGEGDASLPHPTVGLTCITSPVVDGPRSVVQTDGVSMKPSPNGGLTLTDHPTASQWDAADPGLWSVPGALLDRARSIYPALESVEVISSTIGHRVLPADGVTIADWLGPKQQHYVVATHSGVTLSAHLAEAVAEEISSGRRDESLTDFGLDRFAAAHA